MSQRFVVMLEDEQMNEIKEEIAKHPDLYPFSKGYREIVDLGFEAFKKRKTQKGGKK